MKSRIAKPLKDNILSYIHDVRKGQWQKAHNKMWINLSPLKFIILKKIFWKADACNNQKISVQNI